MTKSQNALSGYAAAAKPVRTARSTEYAVFSRMTQALKEVDETDRMQFPRLAEAIHDNQRLWLTLAEDLMLETNELPLALRGQLLSLAAFVRKHSTNVLAGRGSVEVLIEINTSIMRGLRGEAEVAA